MKQPRYIRVVSVIGVFYEVDIELSIEERFVIETLAGLMMNCDRKDIKYYKHNLCFSLNGIIFL